MMAVHLQPILAAGSQAFAVALIVAAALGYLLLILRRSWASGEHGTCGSCHLTKRTHPDAVSPATSNVQTSSEPQTPAEPAPPQSVFVPLENLTTLARERRRSLDSARPAPSRSTPDPAASPESRP